MLRHAVSFWNEILGREYPRFPLPSCFSAWCYPWHHFKVTSWQMLLTVCKCPILLCKTTLQSQAFLPSPLPHGGHPLFCNSPLLHGHITPAEAQTHSALELPKMATFCSFGLNLPFSSKLCTGYPLNTRFSKEMWTGWRESQERPLSWSQGWETCHMRKVWENWACSALRKEVLGDTSLSCSST